MTAKHPEVKEGLQGEGRRPPARCNRPQHPGREYPSGFRLRRYRFCRTWLQPRPGPVGQIGAQDHSPRVADRRASGDRGWPRSLFDVGNRLGAGDDAGDVGVFPLRHRAIGLLLVPDFPPLGFFALPYFARQFLPSLLEWIDTRSHYSGAV
jgi:hypothetical protein